MFNIGGGELIVIMLIALIVLGPQRLPDVARQVGKAMGDLRRLSTGFQNEMKSALDTADDPTRVAARRNVLAKEASDGAVEAEGSAASAAIESVSGGPSSPVDSTAAGEEPAAERAGEVAPDVSEPDARRTDP